MVHHTFQAQLKWRREEKGRLYEEIDAFLGAEPGTCEAWEDGRLPKPSEAVIGRLFGCSSSAFDRKLDRVNDLLDAFARRVQRAADNGVPFTIASVEALWRKAQRAKAFRGASSDEFWDEQIEKMQERPELNLK